MEAADDKHSVRSDMLLPVEIIGLIEVVEGLQTRPPLQTMRNAKKAMMVVRWKSFLVRF